MKSKSLQGILKEPSVVFEEASHTYTRKDNGEFYTGCTTISDAWDKAFFLAPWTAKMMAEELKSKIQDVGLMFQDNPHAQKDFETIVDEAKGAAKRFSEKAKKDGTAAHDYIEQLINKCIEPEWKITSLPDSQEAKNAIAAFSIWLDGQKNITWLASEEVVCSDDYRVAGKLDALASIDGLLYLVDFKTSSQLSESYLLQAAGYDIMLREMGVTVQGYLIIRIPKDGKPAETLTVTNRNDMDFFRKTFLMQREAHKFYTLMQSKFKDERGKMKIDKAVNAIKENEIKVVNQETNPNGHSKSNIRQKRKHGKGKAAKGVSEVSPKERSGSADAKRPAHDKTSF